MAARLRASCFMFKHKMEKSVRSTEDTTENSATSPLGFHQHDHAFCRILNSVSEFIVISFISLS